MWGVSLRAIWASSEKVGGLAPWPAKKNSALRGKNAIFSALRCKNTFFSALWGKIWYIFLVGRIAFPAAGATPAEPWSSAERRGGGAGRCGMARKAGERGGLRLAGGGGQQAAGGWARRGAATLKNKVNSIKCPAGPLSAFRKPES